MAFSDSAPGSSAASGTAEQLCCMAVPGLLPPQRNRILGPAPQQWQKLVSGVLCFSQRSPLWLAPVQCPSHNLPWVRGVSLGGRGTADKLWSAQWEYRRPCRSRGAVSIQQDLQVFFLEMGRSGTSLSCCCGLAATKSKTGRYLPVN